MTYRDVLDAVARELDFRKKKNVVNKIITKDSTGTYVAGECPSCGYICIDNWYYCPECGQHIDFDGEEVKKDDTV